MLLVTIIYVIILSTNDCFLTQILIFAQLSCFSSKYNLIYILLIDCFLDTKKTSHDFNFVIFKAYFLICLKNFKHLTFCYNSL